MSSSEPPKNPRRRPERRRSREGEPAVPLSAPLRGQPLAAMVRRWGDPSADGADPYAGIAPSRGALVVLLTVSISTAGLRGQRTGGERNASFWRDHAARVVSRPEGCRRARRARVIRVAGVERRRVAPRRYTAERATVRGGQRSGGRDDGLHWTESSHPATPGLGDGDRGRRRRRVSRQAAPAAAASRTSCGVPTTAGRAGPRWRVGVVCSARPRPRWGGPMSAG